MEKPTRILETAWKNAERTDKTGECFTDGQEHFFRQDDDKVLHVADGIVNTLEVDHLAQSRLNWGDKYERIDPLDFNHQMVKQMKKFYE